MSKAHRMRHAAPRSLVAVLAATALLGCAGSRVGTTATPVTPAGASAASAAVAPATPATPAVAASAPPPPARPAGVPDAGLGLAKGSVFDVATPPAVKPNDTSPGDQPVLPRAYVNAPPRIPHGVAEFLPITRTENACVGCHEVPDKQPGGPTPIPPSHYTDNRNAPGRVGSQLVGARHVCVSCHVPTTDAPDLVANPVAR